jgi:hypothetical protein
MARGHLSVDQQRMQFVVCAQRREKSMRALCAEIEVSRPTGYPWLQRYCRSLLRELDRVSQRPTTVDDWLS